MAKICGANTKRGGICTQKAMPNGRCHWHGGQSPGGAPGNTNSRTHGIYSAVLTDEERGLYFPMLDSIGKIEDEITMARLRLFRAKRKMEDFEAGNMLPPVSEISEDSEYAGGGDGPGGQGNLVSRKRKMVRKVPDFEEIIFRYLGRIVHLEKARYDMTKELIDDVPSIAAKIRQAVQEFDDSIEPPPE